MAPCELMNPLRKAPGQDVIVGPSDIERLIVFARFVASSIDYEGFLCGNGRSKDVGCFLI